MCDKPMDTLSMGLALLETQWERLCTSTLLTEKEGRLLAALFHGTPSTTLMTSCLAFSLEQGQLRASAIRSSYIPGLPRGSWAFVDKMRPTLQVVLPYTLEAKEVVLPSIRTQGVDSMVEGVEDLVHLTNRLYISGSGLLASILAAINHLSEVPPMTTRVYRTIDACIAHFGWFKPLYLANRSNLGEVDWRQYGGRWYVSAPCTIYAKEEQWYIGYQQRVHKAASKMEVIVKLREMLSSGWVTFYHPGVAEYSKDTLDAIRLALV